MKKHNYRYNNTNLKSKLINLCVTFILVFAFLFYLISSFIITNRMEENAFDINLGVANQIRFMLESRYNGDFHMEGGRLYSGIIPVQDDFSYLNTVKEEFGSDITIFYGNVRMLTTIVDKDEKLVVGTVQADKNIIDTVFSGAEYKSNKVIISGERYYGNYIPLYDNNNAICGMIFAGQSYSHINSTLKAILNIVVLLTVGISVIAILILRTFASNLCKAIFEIENYLGKVSNNQLDIEMDESVLKRNDEIGNLGRYSIDVCDKLLSLMNNDPLTNLYNRRSAENHLYNLQDICRGQEESFTIVICDIDHFKNINDTYGHDVGDQVLVGVAEILKAACFHPGFAARWGGEEFLLVINKHLEDAKPILEDLKEKIKSKVFKADDKEFSITLTFGVSTCTSNDNIYKEIKIADEKLYRGKESGRDKIVY